MIKFEIYKEISLKQIVNFQFEKQEMVFDNPNDIHTELTTHDFGHSNFCDFGRDFV